MSKELEALEKVKFYAGDTWVNSIEWNIIETALKDYEELKSRENNVLPNDEFIGDLGEHTRDEIAIKLKALEIIKNKPWLVNEIVESKGNYDVYKSWCRMFRADMKYRATQEEYDLLKEILL